MVPYFTTASSSVPESNLAIVGAVVGVMMFLALSTMFLLYCIKKWKGKVCLNLKRDTLCKICLKCRSSAQMIFFLPHSRLWHTSTTNVSLHSLMLGLPASMEFYFAIVLSWGEPKHIVHSSTFLIFTCITRKLQWGYLTPSSGQQQQNTGQNEDHRLSVGNEEDRHEYETFHSGQY